MHVTKLRFEYRWQHLATAVDIVVLLDTSAHQLFLFCNNKTCRAGHTLSTPGSSTIIGTFSLQIQEKTF